MSRTDVQQTVVQAQAVTEPLRVTRPTHLNEYKLHLKTIQKTVANMLIQGPEIDTEFAYERLADIVQNAMGAGVLIGQAVRHGRGRVGQSAGMIAGSSRSTVRSTRPSFSDAQPEWSEADLGMIVA